MKQFSEQLKKSADSIRLKAAERRDLKDRLVAYMEYHPLPVATTKTTRRTTAAESIPSEAFTVFSLRSINTLYARTAFGFCAVFLLVTIPIAAERSMPGDVLYPIKVSFNEELRSTLTASGYEKVEWEAERLSRRIAEARLLASEGKLTPEFEAEVAAAVKEHSDAAQAEINTLRTTDADEAAIAEIAFTSALDIQTAVLEADEAAASTTDDGTPNEIAIAIGVAKAEADEAADASVPNFARLSARVEIQTTRAEELFSTVSEYAAQPEINDIERRLSDIDRKVSRANELAIATSTETEAVGLMREALTSTQKLIAFMTDIHVRETITIDDLLPAEFTPEERQEVIANTLARITALQADIDMRRQLITDEAVLAKVDLGLVELEDRLVAMDNLAESDPDTLTKREQLVAEAYAFADDVNRLLITAGIELDISDHASTSSSTPVDLIEETAIDAASSTLATTTDIVDAVTDSTEVVSSTTIDIN